MEKWHINTIIAGLGTAMAQLMGGWDAMLQVLCIMVVLDYVTGILSGAYNGKLSSETGYKGIIKKIGIFVVVVVATCISRVANIDFIRDVAIIFYISNEGISVLENLGKSGVKYPKKLKDILLQLNKDKPDKK